MKTRSLLFLLFLISFSIAGAGCNGHSSSRFVRVRQPGPTPTRTPPFSPTPTPSRTPTAIGTPTITSTAATRTATTTLTPSPTPTSSTTARPHHVFIIVLENEEFTTTFGAGSPATYLNGTLVPQGELLTQYYATGHLSNDNYVSMISGQAPNPQNQADCQDYTDFVGSPILDSNGQAIGNGCVFPATVQTVANQLEAAGFTWGGFMEDMGNTPSRESAACGHPALNAQDNTQTPTPQDQYATRHNPFVYFHSIVDSPTCNAHDVALSLLPPLLSKVSTTPNYVFITPNLCDDGHDAQCADGRTGGLVGADTFLQKWVPMITGSPAYQQDGILLILFDEANVNTSSPSQTDSTSCCGEAAGPNSPQPGIFGPGGGRTGALILSPFTLPGTTNSNPYNHYAMLRSIEDLFGLPHLGFAGQSGLNPFGPDVYNGPGPSPTPSGSITLTPTATPTSTLTQTPTPTATPTPPGGAVGLNKINHIVIAMQENHSFDNYFGELPYAMVGANPGPYHSPPTPAAMSTPACDPNDHQCVDGLNCTRTAQGGYTCQNSNIDCVAADASGNCTGSTQSVLAFHDNNYCVSPDLDHEWDSSHREENWANPLSTAVPSPNDGFVRMNDLSEQIDLGESPNDDDTIGFYNEADLPFYYGLAETFAINDRYFCDVVGPTTPNRFYFVAATSFGHVVTTGEELPPNGTVYKPITGTIYDLLNNAGVSWKNYFSDVPTAGDFVNPSASQNATHFASVSQFIADAQAGNLPAVSFVDPALAGASNLSTDEHPPHDIRAGQSFMSQVVNALCYAAGTTSGPCNGPSWKDSALFITYDEHGGAYDHVTPQPASQGGALTPEQGHLSLDGSMTAPAIPPGQCADLSNPPTSKTPGSGAQCTNSLAKAQALCTTMTPAGPYPASCANFNQLGFRVPFIAVSPFAKPTYVSHTVGDHTSMLALIEKRFLAGKSLTNRDANANDLEDMFDFSGSGPSLTVDLSKVPAAPAPNVFTDGNGSCGPTAVATATPTATPTP